jgi:predicted signal transduction protein with EAL and GGDEF domain
MAQYRAKLQGRGRFCFYDVGMRLDAQRRANLEADLHLTIANGGIACHRQPIVSLQPCRPLVGLEALARWHHPVYGTLPTREYAPQLSAEQMLKVPVPSTLLSDLPVIIP